jgi:hypothetical protein
MRASTSGALPGVEGATSVIVREGYSSPWATPLDASDVAKRQTKATTNASKANLLQAIISRRFIGHDHALQLDAKLFQSLAGGARAIQAP